jgi:hypothetical protein
MFGRIIEFLKLNPTIMKANVFTPTVLFIALILVLSSCRSSRNTGGSTSGKSYPVYNDPNPSNLPPGQAKKIYGDKSAKKYAPGQRKKQAYPLIIVRTPDIVINRHADGRYYYRNAAGYYYWQGVDSRFYLDEAHLAHISYGQGQYDDWKGKGNANSNSNAANTKPHGNGKSKSKGKNR